MISGKVIQLKPIRESKSDYEAVEKRIRELFKSEIYLPLLKMLSLPKKTIENSQGSSLVDAILSGRVIFSVGAFSGKFNASISKELKSIGAKWSSHSGTWRILYSELPREIREAVALSEIRFQEKLKGIDRKLSQIIPEELAEKVRLSDIFDQTLWKTDQRFQETVKSLMVPPQLSEEARKKLAKEWENNLRIHIQDFTDKEILKLRQGIKKAAFNGNRYDSMIGAIEDSFEVSSNKAKGLAKQETGLLMSKFKESRYMDSGIYEYTWHCVAGSPNHPVRPRHKALDEASKKGTVFRFDNPPNTAEAGESPRYNNPGEDFFCRCYARPVVRFK